MAAVLAAIRRLEAQPALPGPQGEDWTTLWRAHQRLRRALELPHELGPPPLLD